MSRPRAPWSLTPHVTILLSCVKAATCIPPQQTCTTPIDFAGRRGFKRGRFTSMAFLAVPSPSSELDPSPNTKTSRRWVGRWLILGLGAAGFFTVVFIVRCFFAGGVALPSSSSSFSRFLDCFGGSLGGGAVFVVIGFAFGAFGWTPLIRGRVISLYCNWVGCELEAEEGGLLDKEKRRFTDCGCRERYDHHVTA